MEDDLLRRPRRHPEHDPPRRPGRHGQRPTTRSSARWGEPRKFDFKPKDHVALAEALDLVDFEAGASVAGQKFYFLKNEAVLLELALVQYAMQTLVREGYTPVITPDVARVEVLEGIGFIPRDPDPDKRQIYSIADTDLCLIATAEITLGGMHRDQIFDDRRPAEASMSACRTVSAPRPALPAATPRGSTASTSSPRSRCSPSARRSRAKRIHQELLAHRGEHFPGAGPALSRDRHLHRRPGRAGLSQVRPGSVDAGPRPGGRIWRGDAAPRTAPTIRRGGSTFASRRRARRAHVSSTRSTAPRSRVPVPSSRSWRTTSRRTALW